MTHAELVARAVRWLKAMGCPLVFAELVTTQAEQPDAIGWRDTGGQSYLIECKTSRGDFLADKKKAHRREHGRAMGTFRYFMCTPGLIRPNELPAGWGLLYCHPKIIERVAGQNPKRYIDEPGFRHAPDLPNEMRMLASALNRLRIDLGTAEFDRLVHMPFAERKRLKPEAFERPRIVPLGPASPSDHNLF